MTADRPPLFSVVIATHNRPAFLAEAIDSVLAQTVQDFEVVVVDDASDPPVPPHPDPRVRIVRQEPNGGPSRAFNTGAEAAVADYLAFLADDDWYTPDRLEVALDGLQRAPVTLCWGGYPEDSGRGGPMLEGHAYDAVLDWGFAPGVGTTALRREYFIPFDEHFLACEDVDWWLRLAPTCRVSTEPKYCYLVRRHDEVRGIHGVAARLDGSLLLLERHRTYFARHRRARAFRLRRIGVYRSTLGQRRRALGSLLRSLAARPDPTTARALLRTLRPRRSSRPTVRGTPATGRP
ncbi:MAG: glycosyltransferase [Acidimicrobiia bacterium]|nr:glycosyltransferase [Acidimicrobiia bacterium]